MRNTIALLALAIATLTTLGCETDCPAGTTKSTAGRCEAADAGPTDASTTDTSPTDASPIDGSVSSDASSADAGCTSSAECNDGVLCNGEEACTDGTCEAGPLPGVETICGRGEAVGVCFEGLCVSPGCGNRLPDEGEDCDDGNDVEDDGCKSDCSFTCSGDDECSNNNACDGIEVCNTTTHLCEEGTAPTCEDSDACTADSCEPETGCVYTLIDEDGDGYSPVPTCTTEGLRGGDCQDSLPLVHPNAGPQVSGYCPGGGDSCSRRSFDYDCDRSEERSRTRVGPAPSCAGYSVIACNNRYYWRYYLPPCGADDNVNYCTYDLFDGTCSLVTGVATQACN